MDKAVRLNTTAIPNSIGKRRRALISIKSPADAAFKAYGVGETNGAAETPTGCDACEKFDGAMGGLSKG